MTHGTATRATIIFVTPVLCVLSFMWRRGIPVSVFGMRRSMCTGGASLLFLFFFFLSLSLYATICMHILFSLYLSECIFRKDPPFVLVIKVHLCCFLSILFQLQDVFISLCNIFHSLSFYFNYLSIYCISLLFSV